MGTPDITPFGRGAKPCCSHVPPNCHSPMGMEQAEVGHSPTCLPPYELHVGISHLSLQRVEVGIQATDVLLGALGTVGLGVPPRGVTPTTDGHFLGFTGHGDTHVNGFCTNSIVFWFLQVEE